MAPSEHELKNLGGGKNDRVLLLTKMYLHTKYELDPNFLPQDIVLTRFSEFDPRDL